MTIRPDRPRRAALIATIALAGLALAACSSSGAKNDKSSAASAPVTGPSSSTGSSSAAKTVNVTITAAGGCTLDNSTIAAGGVTFNVTNKDATAVSEVELVSGGRIVGERENLPPGLQGEFSVTVEAGKYQIYCPGAKVERVPVTAVGESSTNTDDSTQALLAQGTKQWGTYVSTQVGYLVASAESLATALKGTDLTAAQTAYMKARPYYEKIEPVAESFVLGKTSLDANLDAREGDVPPSQWQGFHRIEKGLFADKSLKGLASFGDGLVANSKKLQSLTKGLTYKPFELINGAQDLLGEVASSKITGEEERYSHIDMLDFANNDEGAEQAFVMLQPALTKLDAASTAEVATAFTALNKLVDTYRTTANASGYQLYNALTAADKRQLAAAVKAVQEPLASVAKTVATS
jgi:iron uptake system component EfeO